MVNHIEQHGFSQAYLVTTLKAHHPDVRNLRKGRISKVGITKLIQFAGRLNLDARIKVTSLKMVKSMTASSVRLSKKQTRTDSRIESLAIRLPRQADSATG